MSHDLLVQVTYWSSLANSVTKHNTDLSKLLSFDKMIISKLNWAVFFKKHHILNNNPAFSKIQCVEHV